VSHQTAVSRRKIAGERSRRSSVGRPPPDPAPVRAAAAAVDPLGADGLDAADRAPIERAQRVTRLRGRVLPGWLLLGLAAMTAAALVFDGVTWARSSAVSAGSSAIGLDALSAAPAQAEQAAEQILSYDYADLPRDTAAAAATMTPAYAQTFQRTVDDLLTDPAARPRGVVKATVTASGVVSADAATVEVLLFVDQTSTTAGAKTPQTTLNRVVLTMVYADGRWLVDDVTAL
jgi:Mce-associated membrane protein